MAEPDAVGVHAAGVIHQHLIAVEHFDAAHRLLDEILGRLRLRLDETDALASALHEFDAAGEAGIVAFYAMLRHLEDMRRAALAHAAEPLKPVDRDTRVDELRLAAAERAEEACAGLGTLGAELRAGGSEPADIARLAEAVRAQFNDITSALTEACEVSACAGSA